MEVKGAAREKAILALYQDTQGATAVVVDGAGRLLGRSYAMLTQHQPQPGWVEYDPHEIWHRSWQAVEQVCKAAGTPPDRIAALGLTAQQGTVLFWERATGRPVGPAVSWRCRRTAALCEELRAAGHEALIRQRTGGLLDTTTAGPKIAWLLANVPGLHVRAKKGEVCCGTVDSWLLWNLTGGAVHATDRTSASDTLLMDLRAGDWDDELLALLGVPRAILPEIRPSGAHYGQVQAWSVPIAAVCADPQASLLGQACFAPGVVKVIYGRDALVLADIGPEPLDTAGQLRTAAAAVLEREAPRFVLAGRVLTAGLVVEWLRDELALIPTAADSEMLAQQAGGTGGVYLIPALLGLGAPYWNARVRGGAWGLTPATTRAQFVRAALEGVAYRVADIVAAMTHWTGQPAAEVRADGGAAANNFLLQFQASLLGVPVRRGRLASAAAAGAGYLAGLQAGLWNSREQLAALWPEDRRFEPGLDDLARQTLYQGWKEAVYRLIAQ